MIFIYCLRKGYLLVEWCPTSNFSQPIPPSLRVSHISVTWHLPATHSYVISSQIERREIGADWRDQFWCWKDRSGARPRWKKMWTQSAMCWLCWLGACAKNSLSIPSFLLFTLCLTILLNTGSQSALVALLSHITCITGRLLCMPNWSN